ncbi:MAG: hypothetical protein IPJ65_20890 [Archangiaceae bacterium]|nr:hypothetical protein [Archangiaceae bacterium]
MKSPAAANDPMPTQMRRALSHALDRLTRAREARLSPDPTSAAPALKVPLSRKSRQKMMALLRKASHAAGGRPARGDGIRAVWGWLRELDLDGRADSFLGALSQGFTRLPLADSARAPPGAVVLTATTAAVKGFGQKLYADGEAVLSGELLGVWVPR